LTEDFFWCNHFFTDDSGFRPGIETIGWLYGEAAKKMFEQPNLK
jgi:hypothetical protein